MMKTEVEITSQLIFSKVTSVHSLSDFLFPLMFEMVTDVKSEGVQFPYLHLCVQD